MSVLGSAPMVAVVDDDPGMRESLEDLMQSGGYATRGFASAIALLDQGLTSFDLVISDVGMPTMDGFDFRDLARAMRPDLPVLLITGRQDAFEDRRVPPGQLFRKPFDARLLLAAVGEALGINEEG